MAWGIQKTYPTEAAISLTEAKQHLHMTSSYTDEDDYITRLIEVATNHFEDSTNRQLVNATFTMTLDEFPSTTIVIPRVPLSSVASIQYVDTDGNTQTWDSTEYRVSTRREPGTITRAYGGNFPNTQAITDAVTITFVAGYGTAADVPETMRQAVCLLISHYYELREPVLTGSIAAKLPYSLEALINLYRVVWY